MDVIGGVPAQLQRFMTKVSLDPISGCWNWVAGTDQKGYGNFRLYGRHVKAHRAAWRLLVGAYLSDHITLDHRCLNRGCVNPTHLEPVTREENSRRRWARKEELQCRS